MSELIDAHLTWLRAGCADSTVNARERLLWHAHDHLPHGLEKVRPSEISRYLDQPDWSPWTLHTYDKHLRGFYGWAVDVGELTYDPMLTLRRPPEGERLPDPCTDEELARLFAEAPECPWHMVWLLAAYEGLRVSELARLDRRDVTAELVRVRRGKGDKDAYVDTHPLVWDAVKDLPPGPLVRDPNGEPVTGYQLTNRGWYLFRRLDMPDMRIHRLRHWHATTLLERGADVETVRLCMRHANIASTINYLRIRSATRRAAVLRLPVMGHEPVSTRLVPAAEAA